MFIGERIFRELEEVDESSFDDFRSHEYISDEYTDILHQLAEKEIVDTRNEYEDEDEWIEAVYNEISNIIRVVRFNRYGLLAMALHNYYGGHEEMINGIRSCIDNYPEDDYIYYVTGIGYDTISADLLNGNADGKAKNKFIAEINKDNEDKDLIERYERMAE